MAEISRRRFLQYAGGGAALAGMGNKTVENLIPYTIAPDEVRPAVWTVYATTCRECPAGCGLHVRTVDGRPIKGEGSPDHPVNRGGLCARGQAAVQGLYDPDRIRSVIHRRRGKAHEVTEWSTAIDQIATALRTGRVALLSDLQTGSLAELMAQFVGSFGSDRLVFYEPFHCEPLRAAHAEVFATPVIPEYRLDQCEFVISFGADFLEAWISNAQFASQFAQMHAYRNGRMGRLVYVGPRLSLTAANADDFVQVPPGAEAAVALAMLRAMADQDWLVAEKERIVTLLRSIPAALPLPAGLSAEKVIEMARSFARASGSVALAGAVGASGPAATDAAVAAALLNASAGRIGQTVHFSRPHALSNLAAGEQLDRFLTSLTAADVLIVHQANPAYAMTTGVEHLNRAGTVVYLGTMLDETAEMADWVLPIDSPFESWGDYEPWRGLHSLIQPTVARLYDSRPAGDLLLALAAKAGKTVSLPGADSSMVSFEDCLHRRWESIRRRMAPERSFDEFWHDSLSAGGAWEADQPQPLGLVAGVENYRFTSVSRKAEAAADSAFLWPWPSIMLFDGRVANRGWLQENPEPVSTIAWGNWIDLHPKMAAGLAIGDGDLVELTNKAGRLVAPARITTDVEQSTAAVSFGHGHTALGRHAAARGANAFALLGSVGGDGTFGRVVVRKKGPGPLPLNTCATQEQHGRKVIAWVRLSELREMKPGDGEKLALPLPEGYVPGKDLYRPPEYPKHRWAMVIDLARCIGCGACAVACYAENNLQVVGEDHTRRHHQMAWLRVIPYRQQDNPRRLGFIPVLCQHCDAAPCEPVCPVFASVHNEEGLNSQVYNRCVGTRYCSNNCPYKVRRFNWINPKWPEPLNWQLNPEVTARARGVMEKCTFCIQRIRQAQHQAKREGRSVRDGEIAPACAQSCPTRAFTFGDLLDPASSVSALTRTDPRRYHVLEELNTKPAVTYLKRIETDVEDR